MVLYYFKNMLFDKPTYSSLFLLPYWPVCSLATLPVSFKQWNSHWNKQFQSFVFWSVVFSRFKILRWRANSLHFKCSLRSICPWSLWSHSSLLHTWHTLHLSGHWGNRKGPSSQVALLEELRFHCFSKSMRTEFCTRSVSFILYQSW